MRIAPREPRIEHIAPGVAEHDQRCAVISGESAVLNLDKGVFEPSWAARAQGWRLICVRSRFQRWLLRAFFNGRPGHGE